MTRDAFLQLLASSVDSDISEYIALLLYHLSSGLLQVAAASVTCGPTVTCDATSQFHQMLRNFNVIDYLLDCIESTQAANTVAYSCRALFNLIEFHEPSQAKVQEARATRLLRDVLRAAKGEEEVKRAVRLVMQKAKIKERATCSVL